MSKLNQIERILGDAVAESPSGVFRSEQEVREAVHAALDLLEKKPVVPSSDPPSLQEEASQLDDDLAERIGEDDYLIVVRSNIGDDYGLWDPGELVELVEGVIALHAVVWPEGEVDGDGSPSQVVLGAFNNALQQVQRMREIASLATAAATDPDAYGRILELVEELQDYAVLPEA